CINGVVWTV
nr:Chain P, 9-meric peptide from Serine protease/NTPase/helicase NS3 [Hepatitis C virus isolate HC-J1]